MLRLNYSSLNIRILSSLVCVSTCLAAGCAVEAYGGGESTDERASPLYLESSTTWQNDTIHVCFTNPAPSNAVERGWIKSAAEGSWELVSKMNLVGWDACPNNPPLTEQWLKIELLDVVPHTRGLGNQLNHKNPGMVLNVAYQNTFASCNDDSPFVAEDGTQWDSKKQLCVYASTIHEFGHALGFGHEHDRPDLPDWALCEPDPNGGGDVPLGDWDLYSVMSQSYCIRSFARLSPTDIAGMHVTYGPRTNSYFWFVDGNTQVTHDDLSLPPALQVQHHNLRLGAGFETFTGDFDGDGHGDLFRYGPGDLEDGIYYGKESRSQFSYKDEGFQIRNTYRPVAGNFDGLYGTDIFWYRPGEEPENIWWSNGASRTFTPQLNATNIFSEYEAAVGDFDGDGRDDIFWFGSGAGRDTIWWGTTSRTFIKVDYPTNTSAIPVAGDFDGDGKHDIFFFSETDATEVIWWGKSDRSFTHQTLSQNVVGEFDLTVGDFDHNGTSDIIWNRPTSLNDRVWLWKKGQRTFITSKMMSIASTPKGRVADFDADGVDDIFWHDN